MISTNTAYLLQHDANSSPQPSYSLCGITKQASHKWIAYALWLRGSSAVLCTLGNLVGATLPEHYLADGDNGNRATASEMSLPTLLKFKRRQRVIKYMLRCILDRVIAEARKAGRLGPDIDTSYEITFPEIDSGEHHTLAQGMSWLVPALQTARQQRWISDETAMRIMFEYCGEEVDIQEELARIARQK